MKQKLLIVTFWSMALIGVFSVKTNAQERAIEYNVGKNDTVKVWFLANETTVEYIHNGAVIKSLSDVVVEKILSKWDNNIVLFTWVPKKSNGGKYKSYSIYINKEDVEPIRKWAKNNL